MPFKSAKQEIAMKINAPDVWRKWVKKYGHHPGYQSAVKSSAKKGAITRKRNRAKR